LGDVIGSFVARWAVLAPCGNLALPVTVPNTLAIRTSLARVIFKAAAATALAFTKCYQIERDDVHVGSILFYGFMGEHFGTVDRVLTTSRQLVRGGGCRNRVADSRYCL
jgi:hypothetical protein